MRFPQSVLHENHSPPRTQHRGRDSHQKRKINTHRHHCDGNTLQVKPDCRPIGGGPSEGEGVGYWCGGTDHHRTCRAAARKRHSRRVGDKPVATHSCRFGQQPSGVVEAHHTQPRALVQGRGRRKGGDAACRHRAGQAICAGGSGGETGDQYAVEGIRLDARQADGTRP